MSRSGIEESGIIPKLLYPGAYFHETVQFELIETHISWVILTGRFAYRRQYSSGNLERLKRYSSTNARTASRSAPKAPSIPMQQ